MSTNTVALPAFLSSSAALGFRTDIHAVLATPYEVKWGIKNFAASLCGKTHGKFSQGWITAPLDTPVTCPVCLSALEKLKRKAIPKK